MNINILAKKTLRYIGWTAVASIFIICIFFTYSSLRSFLRESSSIEEISPDTGQFVEANGVKIFYQEVGPEDGSPIILLHGTGSWSEIWRKTMSVLADNGYRAIAMDIPPFGYSEKLLGSEQFTTEKQGKRLNAFLEKLDIKNGTLVGHSVGGRPTMEAILNDQNRIDRLVLVDVALGFAPDSITPHFAQNKPGSLLKNIFKLKRIRNTIFRTFGTNPFFTKIQLESFVYNKAAIEPSHLEMLQKPLSLKGTTISNADWFEYITINELHNGLSTEFENFKSITIPALIIWGDKDDITPLWQGVYLSKLFPNVKLTVMNDVGHIPYIENTEKFNEILIEFLSETD